MKALTKPSIVGCRREMVGKQLALNNNSFYDMRSESLAKIGLFAVAAIGFATFMGCGGTYDATAHGIVTLDGRVVPRGVVSFHLVSGGPAAYAMIGDDGSYSIRTGRETGLPSGEYQVSVTA